VSTHEARRLRAAFVLHGLVLAQAPCGSLTGPHDAARAVAGLGTSSREELWALTVDTGLRLISRTRVAAGGRASCSVGPGEILRIAVVDQAAGLFLVHNHPSGDPHPSAADARFTARVRKGAVAVGIRLHDHIVVAGDQWVSELTGTRGRLGTGGPID
jgi:DNA repair protein RadC